MIDPLRDQDIICISSIDWDFLWQGHQEIMSRLARAGNRVLYIENTGVRRPRLSDLPRIKQRLRNWWNSYAGVRQEGENLYIFSPLVVPFPYSRVARWLNLLIIWYTVRRWMISLRVAEPIIWTFLPTPLALSLISRLSGKLLIYYCIDDFKSSSLQARRITPSERRMVRAADLVFVTSRKLERTCLELNPATYRFPFMVNLDHFQQADRESDTPVGLPAELREVPKPIIGYLGGIHQHLDFPLLTDVAKSEPYWSFVFIGPLQVEPGPLANLPNVYFLGHRSHEEVARYLAAFDAALIPYLRSSYTDNVFPTKLLEYFAVGLPVLSTSIPEVCAFREEYGALLALADAPDEFRAALVTEMNNDSRERRAARQAVAAKNTWSRGLAEMNGLIAAKLEQLTHERAKSWRRRMQQGIRSAYVRSAQTVAALLLLYLLIFESPLVWWLAAPLVVAHPPEAADAIVVLAGGVGETGRPGTSTFERGRFAAQLYRQGWAKTVVLVSGFHNVEHEARDMKLFLVSLGVPARAVLLEERAATTYEYAHYVRALLRARSWTSALLISAPYHMRRTMLTFERQAPGMRFVPTPVVRSSFYGHSRGISRPQLAALAHEVMAIIYYRWRGYL